MTEREELLLKLRTMPSSLNDAIRIMELAADFIERTAPVEANGPITIRVSETQI